MISRATAAANGGFSCPGMILSAMSVPSSPNPKSEYSQWLPGANSKAPASWSPFQSIFLVYFAFSSVHDRVGSAHPAERLGGSSLRPERWVTSWRSVISSPPMPFGSGLPSEYLLARSSNPTSPRAISFASSAAVKVLVSEAISNCVRGVTLTPFSTSAYP